MQVRNQELQYFQLGQYGLLINAACYLITVSRTKATGFSPGSSDDLPEWIFSSKHAIWLTEEEKPIADRARSGDAIRKQLREVRPFTHPRINTA